MTLNEPLIVIICLGRKDQQIKSGIDINQIASLSIDFTKKKNIPGHIDSCGKTMIFCFGNFQWVDSTKINQTEKKKELREDHKFSKQFTL